MNHGSKEDQTPKLYGELAGWFHLLTAPADYAEDARFCGDTLVDACDGPLGRLLELGSGGGNVASHLKHRFALTLVDLSPEMLALSETINPECEHIQGDMRTFRLDRLFDAVLIHDAISYMTTEHDLRSAIETAFVHCRPGGAAIFVPDFVRETFRETHNSGGHNDSERSLRYVEWIRNLDPTDSTYLIDFAYLLSESDGSVRVEHDRHVMGLFGHEVWLRALAETGFSARSLPFDHGNERPGTYETLLGVKPPGSG